MQLFRLSLFTLACLPAWSQAAPLAATVAANATAERSLERLTVFG